LCGLDWQMNRVQCAACFEEDPAKLPFFQSDAYSNVRIETCETCRRYIKSIDLTIDARPVPIIDDLLSISRLEADGIILHKKPLNLLPLARHRRR
jgi:FdhE protein